MSGTLAGRFRRKRTGATTWDEARAYSAAIEAVGNWSGQPAPAVPAPDAPAAPARITIADATDIFLTNRASAQIAPATLRKYRTFTKQLTAYADGRGYVMIDQFTPADADRFYAGLKLGPRTRGRDNGSAIVNTIAPFDGTECHDGSGVRLPLSGRIRMTK